MNPETQETDGTQAAQQWDPQSEIEQRAGETDALVSTTNEWWRGAERHSEVQ